jgi:hypothetical protein
MKDGYIFLKQKFLGNMERKLNNEKTQEAIMKKT